MTASGKDPHSARLVSLFTKRCIGLSSYREEKKTAEGKPVLEMGGDGRIRYSSDGDADGRVRINTRWHIDRDTTVNAGGTKNVD